MNNLPNEWEGDVLIPERWIIGNLEIIFFPDAETTNHCSRRNKNCQLRYLEKAYSSSDPELQLGDFYSCSSHNKPMLLFMLFT